MRKYWNPARDQILRANYHLLGPTSTASLLGTTQRSVVNRAYRLRLKAGYPKHRARPSFPYRSWTKGECLLAQALLDLFQSFSTPSGPRRGHVPDLAQPSLDLTR
jgi:hypothetical protein